MISKYLMLLVFLIRINPKLNQIRERLYNPALDDPCVEHKKRAARAGAQGDALLRIDISLTFPSTDMSGKGKAKAASSSPDDDEDSDVELDGMDLEGMEEGGGAGADGGDDDDDDDDDGIPSEAGA